MVRNNNWKLWTFSPSVLINSIRELVNVSGNSDHHRLITTDYKINFDNRVKIFESICLVNHKNVTFFCRKFYSLGPWRTIFTVSSWFNRRVCVHVILKINFIKPPLIMIQRGHNLKSLQIL